MSERRANASSIFGDPYRIQSKLGTVPLPTAEEVGIANMNDSGGNSSDDDGIDYNDLLRSYDIAHVRNFLCPQNK